MKSVDPSEMVRGVQEVLDGGLDALLSQAASGELESLLKDVVKEISTLDSMFVSPYRVAVRCEACGYGRNEDRCLYCGWVSQALYIGELEDELRAARGEEWFSQWLAVLERKSLDSEEQRK